MGIQSKRKHSSDETLHTLNEQLQAPCVNYRCYCSCLWQCCARLRHFESKEMPWQNIVRTTGNAQPLRLATRATQVQGGPPSSGGPAGTSASVKIAIKESTTPGTTGEVPLYTALHGRTGLMWPNNFLKTLSTWTALMIMVQHHFMWLQERTVLVWQKS